MRVIVYAGLATIVGALIFVLGRPWSLEACIDDATRRPRTVACGSRGSNATSASRHRPRGRRGSRSASLSRVDGTKSFEASRTDAMPEDGQGIRRIGRITAGQFACPTSPFQCFVRAPPANS